MHINLQQKGVWLTSVFCALLPLVRCYVAMCIWRWAEKFIVCGCSSMVWVWCNSRIWPNVVGFSTSVLQSLDSRGIEPLIPILEKSPQLQIWPHQWSDTASQQSIFCQVGEQKIVRWCQIRRVGRGINQFKATITHSSHCYYRLACRSIVLVKQDSLRQPFPGRSRIVYIVFFKVPNYLSSVGLSGREQCKLVSEEFEFNACHISLLVHNSVLVSLWTFQPTLVTCNKILMALWYRNNERPTIPRTIRLPQMKIYHHRVIIPFISAIIYAIFKVFRIIHKPGNRSKGLKRGCAVFFFKFHRKVHLLDL